MEFKFCSVEESHRACDITMRKTNEDLYSSTNKSELPSKLFKRKEILTKHFKNNKYCKNIRICF